MADIPARFVIELHPSARDGQVNSWMVTGLDRRNKMVVIACGDTAEKALGEAIRTLRATSCG